VQYVEKILNLNPTDKYIAQKFAWQKDESKKEMPADIHNETGSDPRSSGR
jgi:hypothetical protein